MRLPSLTTSTVTSKGLSYPVIEHRNVTVEFDAPNMQGTIHHRYNGPAALVMLGLEHKGRLCDYVGIDAMTCVFMQAGSVFIIDNA